MYHPLFDRIGGAQSFILSLSDILNRRGLFLISSCQWSEYVLSCGRNSRSGKLGFVFLLPHDMKISINHYFMLSIFRVGQEYVDNLKHSVV